MKIIVLLFFLIFITACSLDTKSGIWNEKKLKNKNLTLNIDDLNQNLTFDEYKSIIINYAKKNKFPNINVD